MRHRSVAVPAQLLLYQRAQESLLSRAIPDAERHSAPPGSRESSVSSRTAATPRITSTARRRASRLTIANGAALALYRLGLAALLPLLAVTVVAGWVVFVALAVAVLGAALLSTVAIALPGFRKRSFFVRLVSRGDRSLENALGRFLYALSYLVTLPFIASFSSLMRLLAFRRIRRQATAFLVSRPIASGAGSVMAGGEFVLSEKAPSVRRLLRFSISPNDRSIFDIGNLMKPALAAAHFHVAPLLALFRREQRLQLGLADSSMLQEAEFLKAGSTALVLEMVEAGALHDAPRLKRPIQALHAIVSDPNLEVEVATDRGPMTALQIQRFYLERARAFVRGAKATSMEALQVTELWRRVLGDLERKDMSSLVGRIDWVTKRYLLEACGDPSDRALLKTIDLRYHEISEGYAARLERSGCAPRLVQETEVERATRFPPEGTPAFTRGRFIRSREPSLSPVRISWESARIGGRLHGRVVRFPGDEDAG